MLRHGGMEIEEIKWGGACFFDSFSILKIYYSLHKFS